MTALSQGRLAGLLAPALTLALLLGGHAVAGDDSNDAALLEKAKQIHSRIVAFDSHVDIPLNYGEPGLDTQVDLPKAEHGLLKGASIAVFVPQGLRNEQGYAKARSDADKKYQLIRSIAEKNPARAAVAYSPADVRRIASDGKFTIVLSLLNAYPLVRPRAPNTPRNELGEGDLPAFQSDLDQIDEWYKRGVRILGFVHAGHNDWADSSRPNAGLGDAAEEHCGLSELGKSAVRRLNERGVLIDVSQLSTHALEQVISLSRAPVAATHSAVKGLVDTPRNLIDEELQLVKKNGGVVQIVAFSNYLRPLPKQYVDQIAALLDAYTKLVRAASGVAGPIEGQQERGSGRSAGERSDDEAETATNKVPGSVAASKNSPAIGSNEELSGIGPVGNTALVEALHTAMIPYSPDELIKIANREFSWCDREMLRASAEMGFGNDWKKAVEAVKNKYVEPGQMIYLVGDLSREAIEFLEKREFVTLPPLVKEDYWEEAMTPRMQLVDPFFTGGATIQVSSPASSQTLQQRMEALRGNNMFFARATVFHELIPGHHMQFYMTQRYRAYRRPFSTPFCTEGMAFYWEMLLWDLGFTRTPEQRVGALVWRMHRCARIIFSPSFHLKKMTVVECVQFLMDRVGFDRANAEVEVRRSFNGSYPPIYQCAYMLGALQFYALHQELVGSSKMSNRAFHDAMYREGNIPVEMLRLALTGQDVSRDYETSWMFYKSLA